MAALKRSHALGGHHDHDNGHRTQDSSEHRFHLNIRCSVRLYFRGALVEGEERSRGICSTLVHAGLEASRQLAFAAVIVLGHAKYYPRFGFQPAARFKLGSEYAVPAEVFMALELAPGALSGKTGTIRYDPAFAQV